MNDDDFLHQLAKDFFEAGLSPAEINRKLKENDPVYAPSNFYFLFAQLRKKGIVTYMPRREEGIEAALVEKFQLKPSQITVVHDSDDVPGEAAKIAATLLQERWKDTPTRRNTGDNPGKAPLGLGLGPGGMTARMTRELGLLLANGPHLQLQLFALSGGAPATGPDISPISFFSEIPADRVAGKVGLFAPNLVPAHDYDTIIGSSGVKEAFARKEEIFLCVTSMGDARVKRDLLTAFLRDHSADALKSIQDKGLVGNLQYRPYHKTGPIREDPDDYRAVTLFELDEMNAMARDRDKHILLMVRRKSRAAMLPLVQDPKFRPFTRLVIDRVSAERLLDPSAD